MKSRLILKALDLSYDSAEEGAMSLKKHATRNSCHRCPLASQVAVTSVHLRRKHTTFSSRIEGRRTCQDVEQLTLSTNGHQHKLSRGRTLDTTASISCHLQTSPPPAAPTTTPRTQAAERRTTLKLRGKKSDARTT
jgi:hypothetical protein